MLEKMKTTTGTAAEINGRLYGKTKRSARSMFITTVLGSGLSLVPVLHLSWHPYYMARPGAAKAFGVASGIALTVFIPVTFMLACVGVTKMSVLLALSRVQLESSFDVMHPKIATLGLRRYVANAKREVLHVQPESLIRFKRQWDAGLQGHHRTQQRLVGVHYAHFMFSSCVLLLPTIKFALGFRFRDSSWMDGMRLIVLHASMGLYFGVCEFKVLMANTLALERLCQTARLLTFDDPVHSMFVDSTWRSSKLTCMYAGRIAVTRECAYAYYAIVLASTAPVFAMML